ncbi:MAG: hypothetical protein GXP32_07305 [Kiritimatiellaeota bacterium]|nr:hypothetical protein [Kiritimatiellota bacterium]
MILLSEILKELDGARLAAGASDSEVASILTDTRRISPNTLFLALKGDKFDGHEFLSDAVSAGAAACCVSEEFFSTARESSIPSTIPLIIVPDTLNAYQTLGRWRRRAIAGLRVVGVTGSCGKTSVKELTAEILSRLHGSDRVLSTESNTNNHIGVPMNLLRLSDRHIRAVIEMGGNHPGEIAVLAEIAEPDIAVITSIASAHLEFFRDLRGVGVEKSAILRAAADSRARPIAVIPEESPANDILRAAAGPALYTFGTADSADLAVDYLGGDLTGSKIRLRHKSTRLTREIKLSARGRVQALNAAAAALAAILAESDIVETPRESRKRVPFEEVAEDFDFAKLAGALESCVISGMRMKILEIDGATWINDAYNANPDSVREAVQWLAEFADPRKSRIALGDMLELGPDSPKHHSEILELTASKLPGAAIFAIGSEMTRAAESSPKLKQLVSTFPDAESAKSAVAANLASGGLVFLKGSRGMALERLVP